MNLKTKEQMRKYIPYEQVRKEMWNCWFRGFFTGATAMAIISIIILIRILVSYK